MLTAEIETAGSSDASAAAAEGNPGPSDILEVTFQKNPDQKNKFLEAESKILGGIIAGSLAIAAQNLHIPTLKACLGMQIVTCLIYGFILIISFDHHFSPADTACYYPYNESRYELPLCKSLLTGLSQMDAIDNLTEAVQIALSITLAAYCCKVIQCCSPRSQVPVIVMRASN
nr:uncharacterized protein LOC129438579 isoform X3 [Misgurnus anguillicaudatus]